MSLKSGWASITSCDVLVVRHDADCGFTFNAAAYSPIIDSIVEYCRVKNKSVQSIATPFSSLTGRLAFNNPVAFNRSFLIIRIMAKLLTVFVGRERSVDWRIAKECIIWRRILKRVEPSLIVGIQPALSLCRSCKQLGIPVYDIQHGVITSEHWWYGKQLKDSVSASDLPTGFLCWDKKSAQVLSNWAPMKGATVEVVGHPWFQRFFFPTENDHLVQESIKTTRVFSNSKPTILISLQWGLHIIHYPDKSFNRVMCDPLAETIKKTQHKYNWLLRLHPVQLRGEENGHCRKYLEQEFGHFTNVDWDIVSDLALPVVLTQVALHITDMSTVVTEASWAGVPSALLSVHIRENGTLQNLYQEERAIGIATCVAQETQAIESWIDNNVDKNKENSNCYISPDGVKIWLDTQLN